MTFTESIRGTPIEQIEQSNLVIRASYRVLRSHLSRDIAARSAFVARESALAEILRATTEIEQVIAAERRKEGA